MRNALPIQDNRVRTVTATRFWEAFQTAAAGRYVLGGQHPRPSSRTRELLDREIHLPARQAAGILWLVAQNLQLEYRREFYGYDVIFHRGEIKCDGLAIRGRWTAPGAISVVLEHENDPETSEHEMYKLSLLAIPLKVLITYPDDYAHVSELLESYLQILSVSPVRLIGTFLVVFGLRKPRSPAEWLAYVYDCDHLTFDFLGRLV